ncbi:MAG TPA: PEP-CTERM sorting domain-containing protein [Myxococcota bacterium]|nr:PEP-CTERM sorting domain-containing protein [Myxococcota bacterium]
MSTKMLLAAVAWLGFAAQSQAVPIEITQTFSSVSWYDYDVAGGVGYGQTPIGDWVFSGFVDSDATDLAPEANIGVFQAASITLTQASLGLEEIGISNMSYLFFTHDRFGFSEDVTLGAPWTRVIYEPNHFLGAQTPGQYLALATTPAVTNPEDGFGPQWDGFALADGRRLHGWGFAASSAVAVVSVPEPGSLGPLLGAFGLMAWRQRHCKAR